MLCYSKWKRHGHLLPVLLPLHKPLTTVQVAGGPGGIHAPLELPHGGHLLARSKTASVGDLLFAALGDSLKAPPIWCGVESH